MGHNSQPAVLQEEQFINSIIVFTLVRVLYISISTDPLLYPSMWLGKRQEREREGELKVSDEDVKNERSQR